MFATPLTEYRPFPGPSRGKSPGIRLIPRMSRTVYGAILAGPAPWNTRAGGQDDVSYANSIKLQPWVL